LLINRRPPLCPEFSQAPVRAGVPLLDREQISSRIELSSAFARNPDVEVKPFPSLYCRDGADDLDLRSLAFVDRLNGFMRLILFLTNSRHLQGVFPVWQNIFPYVVVLFYFFPHP